MGIDGIDSFNAKHLALEHELAKKVQQGSVTMDDYTKITRSNNFSREFGDKLHVMSGSADDLNKAKFTLDDLGSTSSVEAFFKNPHIEKSHKWMPDQQMEMVADDIVNHVHRAARTSGNDPKAIKEALSQKLNAIAADPNKANFMQSFQFERYSTEQMKNVMEAVKGTKKAVTDEYVRTIADAAGTIGVTGVLGGVAYGALKPNEQLQHGV